LWDLLKALSLVEGLPCRDRLPGELNRIGQNRPGDRLVAPL